MARTIVFPVNNQKKSIQFGNNSRNGFFGAVQMPPVGTSGGPSGDALVLESGDYVLLESGDFILLE